MPDKKHMAMASRLMKAKSAEFDKAGRELQKRTPFRKVHEDEVRPGAKPGMPTGVRNMRALQRKRDTRTVTSTNMRGETSSLNLGATDPAKSRAAGLRRARQIASRMGGGK